MIYSFGVNNNLIIEMEIKNKVSYSLKEIEDKANELLEKIEKDEESIDWIVYDFVEFYLSKCNDISDIKPIILKIIDKKPRLVYDIVNAIKIADLSQDKDEKTINKDLNKLIAEESYEILFPLEYLKTKEIHPTSVINEISIKKEIEVKDLDQENQSNKIQSGENKNEVKSGENKNEVKSKEEEGKNKKFDYCIIF